MEKFVDLEDLAKERVIELHCLATILRTCIISDSYKPVADLVQHVRFTPVGEKFLSEILRVSPKANPIEARLAVLLHFDSPQGFLVDSDSTDPEALRKAISNAISDKKILFPWVYGRELVDQFTKSFGVKPEYSNRETVEILKKNMTGVFQIGNFVLGPFGCVKSPEYRVILPTRELDGYDEVHGINRERRKFELSTGGNASIFKLRTKIRAAIPWAIGRNLNSFDLSNALSIKTTATYHAPDAVIRLLGHVLDREEVEAVTGLVLPKLFKRHGGVSELQKIMARIIGDVEKFSLSLERPEALHLLSLATNEELFSAIDEAIALRRLKFLNGASRYCAIPETKNLRLEISPEGIRLDSIVPESMFASNLIELLHRLLIDEQKFQIDDLKYHLNSDASDFDGVIRELARRRNPSEVVKFICGQRDLALSAAKHLGIYNATDLNSKQLEERVSFKLGLTKSSNDSELQKLSKSIDLLESSSDLTQDEIRGNSANVFVALETMLLEALIFSHWALILAKTNSVKSFQYSLEELRKSGEYKEIFTTPYHSSDKPPTLQPLADAFKKLGELCRSIEKTEFEHTQSAIVAKKAGRAVVFKYREMFHNLSPTSQNFVIAQLSNISQLLTESNVIKLRNNMLHGNNESVSKNEILAVTASLRSVVSSMAKNGFFPTIWNFESTTVNSAGFRSTTFKYEDLSIELEEPIRAYAAGLPVAGRHPIFMDAARLQHLGPLRFVSSKRRPNESYWEGFPPEIIRRESVAAEAAYSFNEDSGVA